MMRCAVDLQRRSDEVYCRACVYITEGRRGTTAPRHVPACVTPRCCDSRMPAFHFVCPCFDRSQLESEDGADVRVHILQVTIEVVSVFLPSKSLDVCPRCVFSSVSKANVFWSGRLQSADIYSTHWLAAPQGTGLGRCQGALRHFKSTFSVG
jgi:hypothetical protein